MNPSSSQPPIQWYVNGDPSDPDTCVVEAFDNTTYDCILRRGFDPDTDAALPPYFEWRKNQLLRTLAATRYAHETAGIDVPDVGKMATDRTSQSMIMGALAYATENPAATVNWKLDDGTFKVLTADDIKVLSKSVSGHIQACFANESDLATLIQSFVTVEELEGFDVTVGWP